MNLEKAMRFGALVIMMSTVSSFVVPGLTFAAQDSNEDAVDQRCNDNDGQACFAAGDYYYKQGNFAYAFNAYSSACQMKVMKGCLKAAKEEDVGGHHIDVEGAVLDYEEACKLGANQVCQKAAVLRKEYDEVEEKNLRDSEAQSPINECAEGYHKVGTLNNGSAQCYPDDGY